jgi:flagellar biosynthesis protein FlhB
MADNSAQDRTLPATQRKITKAREDGQVARSRDLGHFAAFFAAGLVLVAFAPELIGWLGRLVASGLRFDASVLSGTQPMLERLAEQGGQFVLLVLPMGLLMVLVALASGVAAGGWNFTWKAIAPTWQKIDPLSGLGRVFSLQQVGQALKACLLALVLGLIGGLFLKANLARFAEALALPLPAALAHAGNTVWAGVVLLLLALGAFALVDVPLQRTLWLKRLKMSHDEVKKEMKEVEGNSEVKAKMRVRMREMANPSHFAVALKYDEHSMGAPRVLAKGADLMAFRIRDAAKAANVPVLEAPPLARALYAHAEVDREIPAALFSAVAQVLAWVYQLRAAMEGRGLPPGELPTLNVPPDLDPANKRQDTDPDAEA